MSTEERYAKIREGVIALALPEERGPDLLAEEFLADGAQGAQALEHLRDVLHDDEDHYGILAAFCVHCGGIVTAQTGPEEIEDEAHDTCTARDRRR